MVRTCWVAWAGTFSSAEPASPGNHSFSLSSSRLPSSTLYSAEPRGNCAKRLRAQGPGGSWEAMEMGQESGRLSRYS